MKTYSTRPRVVPLKSALLRREKFSFPLLNLDTAPIADFDAHPAHSWTLNEEFEAN